jgi:excisionase family DNA binding protein
MTVDLPQDLVTLMADIQANIRELRSELSIVREAVLAPPAAVPEARESYTVEEVAKMLGKSEYTVRQWCNEGRITATKCAERRGGTALWRISTEEVARYKDEGLLPPAGRFDHRN